MTILPIAVLALASQLPADTAEFQQDVRYRIEARLDEETNVLRGRARVHYTNHSSSTLDTLWFHMHLNAFRPNSAWARRELEYDERRFTDLGPEEYAYERLRSVRIAGGEVTPVFPGAPDSTVVGFPLATALAPGAEVTVDIDWDARLSTTPRRQGRRGRHYDFAQWYPRIAVFDRTGWAVQPLLPQGEFYGEFATYDVTLDLMADQVLGATGVPVEGDPGWAAARATGTPEPVYRRDAYGAPEAEPLGLLDGPAAQNRKHVRWHAEDVHHFAWSTAPDYTYEGGEWDGIALHVLYQPGDTAWAAGAVVQRSAEALAFLGDVFGAYPWPQLTNLHRIEGGGTEFPMLVMDGGASEGLIVHETAHQYAHGILANNEWREGWLDEGFASFLGNWYFEELGQDLTQAWESASRQIAVLDASGQSQPIALPSAEFRDPAMYSAMTYTKPSIVLRMLRALMGQRKFREGMRTYFADNRLTHVDENDFRRAMESAYGADLGWFFQQWIHTTGTLDYSIGDVQATHRGGDTWSVTVEVLREGPNWMPVELRVNDQTRVLDSRERSQRATFVIQGRPLEARLDPNFLLLDAHRSNDLKRFN